MIIEMSNDLHIFIQLFIVAGWIVILLFSFFRKWEYMTLAHRILLPIVCLGFSILNTTLFDAIEFPIDWYSALFYFTQVCSQLLMAFSFKHREIKIDLLKHAQVSLEVFKSIADNVSEPVAIVRMRDNILIYSNKPYSDKYQDYQGQPLHLRWPPELLKEFLESFEITKKAQGKVVEFRESVNGKDYFIYKKIYCLMNGEDAIIVIQG